MELPNVALKAPGETAWPRRLRLPAIERNPALLAWSATRAGRLANCGLAFGLLALAKFPFAAETLFVLMLISLFPARRWALTGAATIWFFAFRSGVSGYEIESLNHRFGLTGRWTEALARGCTYLAVALACALLSRMLRGSKTARPVRAFPALFGLVASVAILTAAGALRGAGWPAYLAWAGSMGFTYLVFFLCFDVKDRETKGLARIGGFRVYWSVQQFFPIPKGPAFWRHFEAVDDAAFGRSQLKGLKLLTLAALLWGLRQGAGILAYRHAGIPGLYQLIVAVREGRTATPGLCWAVVYMNFLYVACAQILAGYIVIGIARLSGFCLPRNTYRLLESRTIAEFFNRYMYYFKEVLVELFYLPSFLLFFRGRPRTGYFLAAFFAAGLGNFALEYLREPYLILDRGPIAVLAAKLPYLLYCLVLGLLVGAAHGSETSVKEGRSPLRLVWIVTFFALGQALGDPGTGDLHDKAALAARLFGF